MPLISPLMPVPLTVEFCSTFIVSCYCDVRCLHNLMPFCDTADMAVLGLLVTIIWLSCASVQCSPGKPLGVWLDYFI